MKKRKKISKYYADIAIGLGNYIFYESAVNGYMLVCYMFATLIIFLTILGSINLYILTSEQIAYALKFHGHNWLIYLNAAGFSFPLYYLQWYFLLGIYVSLVVFAFCKRVNGYFELGTLSKEELLEVEYSIDKLKKKIKDRS